MAVFKVQEQNDLEFITNEEGLKELTLAVDVDYVRQKLKHRLLMILGEYFADVSLGFPYLEHVFINSPDLGLIKSLFRNCIQTTPGIRNVISISLIHDKQTRNLSVKFTAITTGGQFLSIDPRVDADFVLTTGAGIAQTPPTRAQQSTNLP